MATEQTRHEATDPQTTPARLQELTSDHDLWPLIAANPSAYDSLVAWLGENGGNDVRAAIATRPQAGTPTAVFAGGLTPPPTGFAHQGQPTSGTGGSTKGLWITLGVLVFLLLSGGIGAGVWALTRDDDSSTSSDDGDDQKKNNDEDRKTDDDSDTTDDTTDDDEKDDDTDSGNLDCNDLEDLEDAAGDLTLYYPGIDDESDLEDAIAVIEEFEGHDEELIAESVDALLEYAEEIGEDEEAMFSAAWENALDAEYEIMDFVFEEC